MLEFYAINIYLKPIGIFRALLGSKNFHKAFTFVATHVTSICFRKMAIKRGRIELSENIDLSDVTIDAVADWDIDEAIICTKWHSWLCSLLGEGIESCPSTSPKDDAKNTLEAKRKKIKT
jgi:hypothetical protein